jgi:hypothetical protein
VKLSTLKNALAKAGVDDATASGIVSAQLEAGEVEDDLKVDDDTLGRHMDAVAKAMGASAPAATDDGPAPDPAPAADPDPAPAADPIAKGDSGDDPAPAADPEGDPADGGLLLTEIVDKIAKGAQDIVEDVSEKHEVLAKAYLDLGKTAQAMSKGLEAVNTRQGAIETVLTGIREDLAKALGQPVPPRAQDFEPVPHPGDGNGSGDSAMTADDVMNKAMKALRETKDARELSALKTAIVHLEIPGCNYQAIAKSLGL